MADESTLTDYERMVGSLDGLPDTLHHKPTTIQITEPLTGRTHSWIVRTVRHSEAGDTIFLERLGREHFRVYIPPKVTAAIRRQDKALTDRARSKASKAAAQARKDRGVVPFQRKQA